MSERRRIGAAFPNPLMEPKALGESPRAEYYWLETSCSISGTPSSRVNIVKERIRMDTEAVHREEEEDDISKF